MKKFKFLFRLTLTYKDFNYAQKKALLDICSRAKVNARGIRFRRTFNNVVFSHNKKFEFIGIYPVFKNDSLLYSFFSEENMID